jgi:hypothetical protein
MEKVPPLGFLVPGFEVEIQERRTGTLKHEIPKMDLPVCIVSMQNLECGSLHRGK